MGDPHQGRQEAALAVVAEALQVSNVCLGGLLYIYFFFSNYL